MFYRKIFSAELDILTPALALEPEIIFSVEKLTEKARLFLDRERSDIFEDD